MKDDARADYKFIKKRISRRVCSRERGLPFGFTFDLHPIPRSVLERPWSGESGQETSEGGREERGRRGLLAERKRKKRRGARRGRRDGLIEAGMMFNSKKLKTRPANYGASRAINPEEDWTRRGKMGEKRGKMP